MNKPNAKRHSLLRRATVATILALAVAACQSPPAGPPEYGERYSVTPVLTTYVMPTNFEPRSGELAREHEGRMQRFVRQFQRRGRSHLVIATTRDDAGDQALQHMAAFRARLTREGIDPNRIDVRPGAAPLGDGHSVVLSFRGYEAEVPECGDWTGTAGFNPGNLPHTNYGCSYQRNFGLMLSDPGDLLQARDSENMTSDRAGGFAGAYEQGERFEAELPTIGN